jgi:hypothetical protein
MVTYAVIEVDDGLTIVEVKPGQSPEEAASYAGGVLIDPGPFSTMDDANSAIDLMDLDTHEES